MHIKALFVIACLLLVLDSQCVLAKALLNDDTTYWNQMQTLPQRSIEQMRIPSRMLGRGRFGRKREFGSEDLTDGDLREIARWILNRKREVQLGAHDEYQKH